MVMALDNLARNAMLAKQSGLSYGRWKAMQPPQKEEPKEIPEGWRECEYCGKLFKKFSGKRFCDVGCWEKSYKARKRY